MRGLIRFIATLITIAIVILVSLIILDMTKYAHDPANATAHAVITSARNLFPENWIAFYDVWRGRFLAWLADTLDLAQSAL